MKLRIMFKDIRGACRNDECQCPIARALTRTLPGNRFEVWDDSISVNGFRFSHTEDSRQLMEEFDNGHQPRACMIEIPNIQPALKSP